MWCSILLLAGVSTLSTAQGTYPACAQSCVSNALTSVSCLLDNATCECAPAYSPAFSKAVTPCVEAACSTDDQYLAIEAYDFICDEWTLSLYTAGLTTLFTTSSLVGGFLTTTAPAEVTSTSSRVEAVTQTSAAGVASATSVGNGNGNGNGNGASSGTILQSSSSSGGLSAGAKAGIGVGAAIGGLLFIGLIVLAFIYGRRSAREKNKPEEAPAPNPPAQVDQFGKVELGGDPKAGFVEVKVDDVHPLSGDEKAELENRRRAKDLENGVSRNSSVLVSPIATERTEVEAAGAERFELEALRREAGVRYELG
ncbi:uncharacterized protein LY89DRAFT_677708 [Mollisia scopiformis]|uniref:CFEM domain-containing protein n=1 Tax=Mollisia scopiformis TaxID=149040 RepID=A0A132B4Z0_MOLSC|nr:uncharacterized protein LY89DRAFT_677708 [Mollisia scopiformis]KUJ07475.1 hypothetical protein LY89DRAFT_677708 [Mollisia scopiformis]